MVRVIIFTSYFMNLDSNITFGSKIRFVSIFVNDNDEILHCQEKQYQLKQPFFLSSQEFIFCIQKFMQNQHPFKIKFKNSYMFDFNCNIKETLYADEKTLSTFKKITPYNDIQFEENLSPLSQYNSIVLIFSYDNV